MILNSLLSNICEASSMLSLSRTKEREDNVELNEVQFTIKTRMYLSILVHLIFAVVIDWVIQKH